MSDYVKMWTPAQGGYRDDEYEYTIVSGNNFRVEAIAKNKTTYSAIPSLLTLNGQSYTITSLERCFKDCTQLVTAPTIPPNVVNFNSCFEGCTNLEGTVTITGWPNSNNNNTVSCDDIFKGTQKQIYVVRNPRTIDEDVRILADGYNNVHFEAEDNSAPAVNFIADRGNYSNGQWTADDSGDDIYLKVQVSLQTDKLPSGWTNEIGNATATVAWNTNPISPTISQTSTGFDIFIENKEDAGTATVTITDKYGQSTANSDYVFQAFILLDFMPGGRGMAIGKAGYRNGLDISIPTAIGEGLELPQKQGAVDLTNYQLVVGKYNKTNDDAVFIVGNGTSDRDRSNLMEVSSDALAFNNKYSEEIFYIGNLDDSTYANKLNWVDYNGESPFTFLLPWDCNSINSLRAYTNNYDYDSTINYTNNYSVSDREITINETACNQMIERNIAFISISYSAQGKFPYYTFGSDGIGAIGKYSFRIGENSVASGNTSFASGDSTIASGSNSHSEGYYTEASGVDSHAEGYYTEASGSYSHGEGSYTKASGGVSHAEGYYSKALENYSHAEGNHTEASGSCAHAEGYHSTASGSRSHAEGYHSTASGDNSHAEGYYTSAKGLHSHTEGCYSYALSRYSHAQNYYTHAASKFQTALGKYNNDDLQTDVFQGDGITRQFTLTKTPESNGYFQVRIERQDVTEYQLNDTILTFDNAPNDGDYIQVFYSLGTYALIIGNGTADNARSNALTVDWQGNVMAQGMAGVIQMYAGTTAPAGWLICDGSEYLINDYPELYAVIRDTYGTYVAPSDSYHFRVPDFRGRVPVGVGNGTATGHTNHTIGQQAGNENAIIPYHRHGRGGNWYKGDGTSGSAYKPTSGSTYSDAYTEYAGTSGNTTGANMMPYLGINYIIATGKTN